MLTKACYPISELITETFTLSDLLHELIHSTSEKAYIYVNEDDDPSLPRNGGFLEIPTYELERMELLLLSGRSKVIKGCVSFDLQIRHLNALIVEKGWKEYITAELCENEYVYLDARSQDELDSETVTFKFVNLTEIFLKAESDLTRKILATRTSSVTPPHQDPDNAACTERRRLLFIIEKALNDPNREKTTSHKAFVIQVIQENGYGYNEDDEVVSHFSYITAPLKDNEKYPMKKKVQEEA